MRQLPQLLLRFMRNGDIPRILQSTCARHYALARVQLDKMEAIAEDNKDQVAKLEEAIKDSK